jgi:hypothetical protein
MLRKNISYAFMTGKSTAISVEAIHKEMNPAQKNSFKPVNIKEVIEKMSLEEYDFTAKSERNDNGVDLYILNVDRIVDTLKSKTVEKMVEQEFSPQHTRVYRLLSRSGALDSKNVILVLILDNGDMPILFKRLRYLS